ncbi:hypothetical protein [Bradyrhizobium sp.]|uniref:hypothetical protein n=1 Tax=Bradyrhizobium sp. TaxID=376 RepID=UPI0039E63701
MLGIASIASAMPNKASVSLFGDIGEPKTSGDTGTGDQNESAAPSRLGAGADEQTFISLVVRAQSNIYTLTKLAVSIVISAR